MIVKKKVTRTVRNLVRRRITPPGAPPGTLVMSAAAPRTRIHVMRFDQSSVDEFCLESPDQLEGLVEPGKVVWVDAQGLGDEAVIRRIGQVFQVHPLTLADIVNTGQRPKAEEQDAALFIVTRMVRILESGAPDLEQVSMYAGNGFVVTFQERYGDCLDPLRERIRTAGTKLRTGDAGFLACMVLDAIVDNFFPVLEHFGERLEAIEHQLIASPGDDLLKAIFDAKRDMMALRRAIWPQREFLTRLLRDGHPLFESATMPYWRDVYDHAVHVVDVTETYRELAQSYIDVYLSSIANRTNEVMRVLTLMATIFIPLTFIAGVYGMNFDTKHATNMPELHWKYGYLGFWALCIAITTSMLIAARRMGWLGGKPKPLFNSHTS